MAGETEVALIHLHRNRDKHRRRRGSVNQTGPTDNLPSSSGAPGLAFSSNTKRRGSIKGGEEEEKTRHRCEASLTQPQRQDDETVEKDITAQ